MLVMLERSKVVRKIKLQTNGVFQILLLLRKQLAWAPETDIR